MICNLCPRNCGALREARQGYCKAGLLPCVARCALHPYEEPPISGTRGSGTIFFCGCNMRCIFCQNSDISTAEIGEECDENRLVELFYELEQKGAHNVNLVSPAIFAHVLCKAIRSAKKQGFSLPFVWNTNGFEKVEALKSLDGLVDIYLPDLKYPELQTGQNIAQSYSDAPDYFQFAAPAILEMKRQVGDLQTAGGIATKGLLVRHLVLPSYVERTKDVLDFISSTLGTSTHLSLMRQYTPMYKAIGHKRLGRVITDKEYQKALDYAQLLGMQNLMIQDAQSASPDFTPAFL